ncbi:hypothetical protein [Paenibacillus sp. Z3-2]
MKALDADGERTKQIWAKIHTAIEEGETASVFTDHRGARLFVMGNIGECG